MGDDGNRTGGQQARFVFGYHEHGPLTPGVPLEGEAGVREFVRQLGGWEWEQEGPAADDLSDSCDPDVRDVADLMALAREALVGEMGMPDEAVKIPFDKLAVLMARGGWSFVGGA